MSLPANASIQAAHSFLRNVRSAYAFMHDQDSTYADERYVELLSRLSEARRLLRWNPQAGRPARFLNARSARGKVQASRALALAGAYGLSELRELVVKPYVLLYAHASDRIVLLALKHERELLFQLA